MRKPAFQDLVTPLLALLAAAWLAWLVAAPMWRATSSPGGPTSRLADLAYSLGRGLCHQRPDRSLHLLDTPLPVCGRCTGLYAGGALGLLLAALVRPQRAAAARRYRRLGVLMASPTLLTAVLEGSGATTLEPLTRGVAALPLGLFAGWLVGVAAHTSARDAGRARRQPNAESSYTI